MTNPGGPVCIDAKGDIDGDGIPNDKDFCDHMPGGAFDEDQDGIGDECDACPIAPPPATPDPDGDGVDSPCDPDPQTPGDRIVLFNGFNAPLPQGWTASINWQVQGGEAIVTPTDTSSTETLAIPLSIATSHAVLFTAYRIDKTIPGTPQIDTAIAAVDRRPAGVASVACGGSRGGSGDLLRLETDISTGTKPFMNLFDPASLYRVTDQLDGASANCGMIADKEVGAVTATTGGNAPTEADLTSRGAVARFSYVLVIAR